MDTHLILVVLTTAVLLTGVVAAQAQMPSIPSMPKEVSGKYLDLETGIEVVFPNGWSGMEMKTDAGLSVMVMSGGMDSMQEDRMIAMMLSIVDKKPAETTPPEPELPTEKKVDCKVLSSKDIQLNEAPATEIVMECSGEMSAKTKAYQLQTEDKWVSVTYVSMPAGDYDSQITAFDGSAKTLKVPNAIPEFPIAVMAVTVATLAAAIGIGRFANHKMRLG